MFLFALVVLSGCGKSGMAEEKSFPRNGEQISRELGEGVTLDAVAEVPEDWDGKVEICRVKNVFFHGRTLAGRLYPEISEDAWEDGGFADLGDEEGVMYRGDIWIEKGQEPQPGLINLTGGLNISTDKAERKRQLFEHNVMGEMAKVVRREFTFSTTEEAEKKAERYWTETIGMEGARPFRVYSVSHEELLAEQERQEKEEQAGYTPGYDFTEADDCYDIRMEQVVNGLPLTANYSHNVRKDGIYVPSGEIVVVCTRDGIEYVSCAGNYEILEKDVKEAVPMDEVYETLERKFRMLMYGTVEVNEMRLVYYPFPLSTENINWEYEFVPAWCFSFQPGETGITKNIYVNAVTGEEIVE